MIFQIDPVLYTEVGKIRPGVIISINGMNHNSPRVIIAFITSTVRKIYPFEVFIPSDIGGLDKYSKIMLDQSKRLDKKLLLRACKVVQRLIDVM